MALHKSLVFRWLIAGIVLAAVVVAHPIWLGALGDFLVEEQEPFAADMAVVLAGGYRGNRILRAAELVRQKLAPRVLVSGPEVYGCHESDLAIAYAVGKGYPEDWFISLPNRSRTTVDEARDVLAELRRRQVRRFLVVTSSYHTRRAGRVYRRLAPEMEFRVVAAPDEDFPARWWHSREGQKTVLLEWTKVVAYWLGR